MYAVIRTGGKQYVVSPGEVIKVEKVDASADSAVEFNDVLALSSDDNPLAKAAEAKATGTVIGHGRGDKILVFHFKRKKQYKKLQGHRQAFTAVRIDAVHAGGKVYSADK